MINKKTKRIIISAICIFIIIYVIYVFISSVFDLNGVDTEVATQITATDSLYKDAIIVRDEKLVKNSTDGIISFSCDDGDKVAKNEKVADIYSSEDDVLNNNKLEDINSEITRLKKLSSIASNGDVGIDTVNSQINNSITELNSRIADKNFLDSENYVDDITYLITERMLVAGKNVDISSRLNDLKSQKQELQNTSNKAVGSVKVSQAGCFVSSADGYESIYKYKNAKSMTITKYNKLLKQKPKKVSSDTIGKLVTRVNWYVICPISKEEALTLKSTNYDSITVNMPYASTSTIPASIESINQDKKGGDSILVLKCNYMNSELASVRKENVEICLKTYEGIRVNKDALHTDYVTKITEDSKGNQKTTKKKVQGVYVLYGNELQFKQVNIIYSGSDFVICDPSSDNTNLYNGETISLYDNIVVKGNDLKDGKIIN